MPIFEYQCTKCGYIFEKLDLNNKKVTVLATRCPNCDNISTKIMSSSNFRIKGYSEKNLYSKER